MLCFISYIYTNYTLLYIVEWSHLLFVVLHVSLWMLIESTYTEVVQWHIFTRPFKTKICQDFTDKGAHLESVPRETSSNKY
mgnify:CR=1 FL=1